MMPTIEAFIAEGYSHRQKHDLIEAMTHAVVDAIDAPIDSVRVILNEVGTHDAGIGGKTGAAISIVQAFLIAGRSIEQKRRLIAGLTVVMAALPGVESGGVRIIIKDIPNTDFGIAGQTAQSLGRGIDRSAMAAAAR
jgi:4-oxalocrotonate tautomerase family enzyme